MAELVDVVEIVVPDGDGELAFDAVNALLAGDDRRSPGLESVAAVHCVSRRKLERDYIAEARDA